MSNTIHFLCLPFTLAIASCAVEGEPTSSTELDVTLDTCATGHDPNASLLFNGTQDTYTRGETAINTTCHCAAWQKDANANGEAHANTAYPDCRPSTYVDVRWDLWLPILAYEVEVPAWSLTNGDTECSNSTLAVKLFKEVSGAWVQQGPEEDFHPTPLGNGVCAPLQITGGGDTGANYRIHARATRGLDANNHGFETVKIYAYGYNE
jgi:hypothetical protein